MFPFLGKIFGREWNAHSLHLAQNTIGGHHVPTVKRKWHEWDVTTTDK